MFEAKLSCYIKKKNGMNSQYLFSQKLFPDTQQLAAELGPTPPKLFSQNTQQKYGTFTSREALKPILNKSPNLPRKPAIFVAPLSRTQNEKQFKSTFDGRNENCIPSSPILHQAKKARFNAPTRPSQPQAHHFRNTKIRNSDSFTTQDINADDLLRVSEFAKMSNHTTKKPAPFSSQLPYQNISPVNLNILPEISEVEMIPETQEEPQFQFDDEQVNGQIDGFAFAPSLKTPSRLNLPAHQTPGGTLHHGIQLRSVDEIPSKFQPIFEGIPYFNVVQSKVFDDAMYTGNHLVVCAPTGSGKTLIFELAIVRLLVKNDELAGEKARGKKPKIVYMAPIKALCSERHEDWTRKFACLDLECQELTGDTDIDDFWQLQKADIILTTPEKWDSMTRRWRDNASLVRQVNLFLIDEVHLLNDEIRGATMEAVVSRMKTIQGSIQNHFNLRFVAVSATIPNTDDIAEWLGSSDNPATTFDMDESYRPVTLRKVVLGYPWSSNGSIFKFDINLNYKLVNVIHTYSDDKPTLVFCSTRKGVEQAASTVIKDATFVADASHKQILTRAANSVRNHRLRELLLGGVGYHHAGLDAHDRHLVEELFTKGDLLVLFSTSTLAMGVNLPAHLVIIKSTCHYVRGMFQEYSQTEILQMTGRAGRPQFDTSATAVIMTQEKSRDLYRNILDGAQNIESSLHKHLIEHLNAEIVLTTIGDVTVALEWIRSTFLYIRILKNPTHYGYPDDVTRDEVDRRLRELCMRNLDSLTSLNLVALDDDLRLTPCEPGRLMARYCVSFETMKRFSALSGTETLEEMITLLAESNEFQEVTLRMNERSVLNKLNKDKNRVTIRYPMQGKIKTTTMKVSCLMQATFGCLSIQEFALQQDVTKIFRNAIRISRCLVELLLLKNNYISLYNGTLLSKCVKARLWENSRYVTKQLASIGPALSSSLANAGLSSFDRLEATDPREIELVVNRHPPFGNQVKEAIRRLPKYTVNVEQTKKYGGEVCDITIQIVLNNADDLSSLQTAGKKHACLLLIGDTDNHVIIKQRIFDSTLTSSSDHAWQRSVTVRRAARGDELSVKLISMDWVGIDIESTYTPYYPGPRRMSATTQGIRTDTNKRLESKQSDGKRRPCRHTCHNKRLCAHDCCKIGIEMGPTPTTRQETSKLPKQTSSIDYMQKYRYNPHEKYGKTTSQHFNQVVPSTPNAPPRSPGWEHLHSFAEQMQTAAECDLDEKKETGEPLGTSEFAREQGYYQDQINLGSRITRADEDDFAAESGKTLVKKNTKDERLWTIKGDSQDDEDGDLQLASLQPRAYKHGLANGSSVSQKLACKARFKTNGGSTPSRMGKVFAWKSSNCERPASNATSFTFDQPPLNDPHRSRPPKNNCEPVENSYGQVDRRYAQGIQRSQGEGVFSARKTESRSQCGAKDASYNRGSNLASSAIREFSSEVTGSVVRKMTSTGQGISSSKPVAVENRQSVLCSNDEGDSVGEGLQGRRGLFAIQRHTGAVAEQRHQLSRRLGSQVSFISNTSSVGQALSCNASARGVSFAKQQQQQTDTYGQVYQANAPPRSQSVVAGSICNSSFGENPAKNSPGLVFSDRRSSTKAKSPWFKTARNNSWVSTPASTEVSDRLPAQGLSMLDHLWDKSNTSAFEDGDGKLSPFDGPNNGREQLENSDFQPDISEASLNTSDERNVSIRCDFALYDEESDDDALLMEACRTAENKSHEGTVQVMEMSEELDAMPSLPTVSDSCVHVMNRENVKVDPLAGALTKVPGGFHKYPEFPLKPTSTDKNAKKVKEMAEAKRMFDALFDNLF